MSVQYTYPSTTFGYRSHPAERLLRIHDRALGWFGEAAATTLDDRIADAVAALESGDGALDRADHLLRFAYIVRLLGVATW